MKVHSRFESVHVSLTPAVHCPPSCFFYQYNRLRPIVIGIHHTSAPQITVISLELWRFKNYITYLLSIWRRAVPLFCCSLHAVLRVNKRLTFRATESQQKSDQRDRQTAAGILNSPALQNPMIFLAKVRQKVRFLLTGPSCRPNNSIKALTDELKEFLVRERSAIATLVVSRRVCLSVCHSLILSFCLSAFSKCFFSSSQQFLSESI